MPKGVNPEYFPLDPISEIGKFLRNQDYANMSLASKRFQKAIKSEFFVAKTMKELETLAKPAALKTLNLSKVKLDPNKITALSSVAKKFNNITSLYLPSAVKRDVTIGTITAKDVLKEGTLDKTIVDKCFADAISDFKNLIKLKICNSAPIIFAKIATLGKLEYLDISGCKIDGMGAISGLPLRTLIINQCSATSAQASTDAFIRIAAMPHLTRLDAKGFGVYEEGYNAIRDGLQHLTHLNLNEAHLAGHGLVSLIANKPDLVHLDIGNMQRDINNENLKHIAATHSKLTWLNLEGCNKADSLSEDGVMAIVNKNPNLAYINLHGRNKVTETCLSAIRKKLPHATIIHPDGKEVAKSFVAKVSDQGTLSESMGK